MLLHGLLMSEVGSVVDSSHHLRMNIDSRQAKGIGILYLCYTAVHTDLVGRHTVLCPEPSREEL